MLSTYCSIYAFKNKPSTIPNSGKGLFAWNPNAPNNIVFKKNEEICNYNGELIDKTQLENRYGEYTAPYGIEVKGGANPIYEDGALTRGIGTIANHKKGRNANAHFVIKKLNHRNHHIALKAIRPILHGEEVFVDYGRDYLFSEGTKHIDSANTLRYNYIYGDKVPK